MTSVFPSAVDNIATNKVDTTFQADDHPDHHNLLADALNAVEAFTQQKMPYLVVAASDAPAKVIAAADYTCDGAADDVQIQAAIDAMDTLGGVVLLTQGNFSLSTKVNAGIIPIKLCGCGIGITNVALANNVNNDMFGFGDGSTLISGVTIADMSLDFNGANQTGGNAIVLNGIQQARIHRVFIQDTVGTGINVGGTVGRPSKHVSVVDCFFDACVAGGVIANQYSSFVKVIGCAGRANGGTGEAAIRSYLTSHMTVIGYQGDADDIGVEIVDSDYCTILGCTTENTIREGIAVTALDGTLCNHNVVDGNTVISPGPSSAHSADGITIYGNWNVVTNNQVYALAVECNAGIAERIEVGSPNPNNNYIANNIIRGALYPILKLGTDTIVRNNKGYVTENSGTGTILSGTTSVAVTHGLDSDTTPALKDITITFGENPTNDPGNWWVSAVGDTQFTVNVRNDPGASNLDFAWRAVVL